MIVSLQEMKDFLGEDGTASDGTITDLILSAEDELIHSTGITDLPLSPMLSTIKRAIRIMVWLSFYADRDAAKNTQYLISERDRLMTKLEWGGQV
jgi:hypothetical protein